MTRREMLSCAAVLLAPRTAKMRFGFTTYQWGSTWDIPTLIANCVKAKAFAVELRTDAKYAHGVEVTLSQAQRREVKKQFADSPVVLLGVASAERFDSLDPARLAAAIERTREHVKLSQAVGGKGVRVVPNDYHKEVPPETTIAQIAQALNAVGKYAAEFGQMIRLENHGSAGDLESLRKIMEQVDQRSVRIKLNGHPADREDFARRFAAVKHLLGDTLHFHELNRGDFPYPLQAELLLDAGWEGWWLLEASGKVPDRLAATIEQHGLWDELMAKAVNR